MKYKQDIPSDFVCKKIEDFCTCMEKAIENQIRILGDNPRFEGRKEAYGTMKEFLQKVFRDEE